MPHLVGDREEGLSRVEKPVKIFFRERTIARCEIWRRSLRAYARDSFRNELSGERSPVSARQPVPAWARLRQRSAPNGHGAFLTRLTALGRSGALSLWWIRVLH